MALPTILGAVSLKMNSDIGDVVCVDVGAV